MSDSRIPQAREKITGLQAWVKEAKELVCQVWDEDPDWSAQDIRDLSTARSELNKVLMGLGGAYACLSRLEDRQSRLQNSTSVLRGPW